MPASRAVACCPRPTRAPTAWAFIQLLSCRKSTRCSAKTAAGTVIRRADELEGEVAVSAVACPLSPVLRRGRTEELLFAGNTQWLITAIRGEVSVLRNVAAVKATLHHWLVGRAVQIIIVVADAVAEIIVELAAALMRRTVRLTESNEMCLKADVATAAEDVSLF